MLHQRKSPRSTRLTKTNFALLQLGSPERVASDKKGICITPQRLKISPYASHFGSKTRYKGRNKKYQSPSRVTATNFHSPMRTYLKGGQPKKTDKDKENLSPIHALMNILLVEAEKKFEGITDIRLSHPVA